MKRKIINHWTAGTLFPNNTDLEHYHFLIDAKGRLHLGLHSVSSNDCISYGDKNEFTLQTGKAGSSGLTPASHDYAAHTGGGNTMSIGVAVCGMAGFVSPTNQGKYKLTKIQTEKLFETNAILAFQEGYKIIDENILMTHMEFGLKHPDTSSAGKIDICWLPAYPDVKSQDVGDFIRNKSQWYLDKLLAKK